MRLRRRAFRVFIAVLPPLALVAVFPTAAFPCNDAPTAVNRTIEVHRLVVGQPLHLDPRAGDADGDAVVVTASTETCTGTVAVAAGSGESAVTYVPAADTRLPCSITVTLTDDTANAVARTITLNPSASFELVLFTADFADNSMSAWSLVQP